MGIKLYKTIAVSVLTYGRVWTIPDNLDFCARLMGTQEGVTNVRVVLKLFLDLKIKQTSNFTIICASRQYNMHTAYTHTHRQVVVVVSQENLAHLRGSKYEAML